MTRTLYSVALILMIVLLCYLVYEGIRVMRLVAISKTLVRTAQNFERTEGVVSVLVLGDSTAASVGSEPALSVPGRLSEALDASVENYATSGAKVRDVRGQLTQAKSEHFDFALIQIGANDVIQFSSLDEVGALLDETLALVGKRADKIIVLTAGKIGDAPLFPLFMRPIYNWRSANLRTQFMMAAEKHGGVYVDIFSRSSPFASDPKKYYAPDFLHLTGEGYGFWFTILRHQVEKKWQVSWINIKNTNR
ncbi:MAG: GDSL-type esterase/lipase family protein [Patescibacteria group bacterium]